MIIIGRNYEDYSLADWGTPYGASATSGPNHDQPPAEQDLAVAKALGKRIATVAQKLYQLYLFSRPPVKPLSIPSRRPFCKPSLYHSWTRLVSFTSIANS